MTVGRRELDHPALAAAGGSALHAAIEIMWTTLSNDDVGRWYPRGPVGNATLETIEHGYGVAFTELTVLLYTGTYPNLTRVPDPSGAGWVIAANGTNPKTQVDITTPGSGGPHTFVLFLLHNPQSASGPTVKSGTATAAGVTTFTHNFGARAHSIWAEYFNGTTHEDFDAESVVSDNATNTIIVNIPSSVDFSGGKQIVFYAVHYPTVGSM